MALTMLSQKALAGGIVSLAEDASWHAANTRSLFFAWDAVRPRQNFDDCAAQILPFLPQDVGDHIIGVIWRAAWHAANSRAWMSNDAETDRLAFESHSAKLAEIIPAELSSHIQWLAWRAAWYAANTRSVIHFQDAAADRVAFSEYASTLCDCISAHWTSLEIRKADPYYEDYDSRQRVASPVRTTTPHLPSPPSVWPRTAYTVGSPISMRIRIDTDPVAACEADVETPHQAAAADNESSISMKNGDLGMSDVKWLFHDAAWYAANHQLAHAVECSRWFPLKAQYLTTLREHADNDKQRFEALSCSVLELVDPISRGLGQTLVSLAWNVSHHVTRQHAINNGVVVPHSLDFELAWRQNVSDLQTVHALSCQLADSIRDMAWAAAEFACKHRSSWSAQGAKEPELRFHEQAEIVIALLQEKLSSTIVHDR